MPKIGVLSDTHLNRVTQEFAEMLKKAFLGIDILLHAGDITSREVYDYLCNWELKAVRGNMDDFDLVEILPEKRVEEVMGRRIGIMHGRGNPHGIEDRVYGEFANVDVIIFGHSHVPLHEKKGSTILFNPGAYRASYGQRGTVGLVEIDKSITFRHIEI